MVRYEIFRGFLTIKIFGGVDTDIIDKLIEDKKAKTRLASGHGKFVDKDRIEEFQGDF